MKVKIINANTIPKIKKLLEDNRMDYNKKSFKKKADLQKLLPNILLKMDKENFELSKINVKDKILYLDKCFMEYAPRVTTAMSNKYYYRGMVKPYEGQLDKLDEEFIVKNFQSLSEKESVAVGFGLIKVPTKTDGTRCCFYRIKLQKGMPYVNMINTTAFKNESEILLPRNIKLKLKKITEKTHFIMKFKYNIYDIEISMIKKDQFKIETGCKNYGIVELSLRDDPKLSSTESDEMKVSTSTKLALFEKYGFESNKINKKLNPKVHKIKLPRCPNGQRRNKKSGKCENKQLTKNALTKNTLTKTTLTKPVKDLKTKKRCGAYRKKSPSPGCDGVDGCKWIPKIGCLKNDPKIIKKEIDKKKNKNKNQKK